MYSLLDLKKSNAQQIFDDAWDYVAECEERQFGIDMKDIKQWLFVQFENRNPINLEYELWLMDNVGFGVALNLCNFKNTPIDSKEKYFVKLLAEQTYRHFIDMFCDGLRPTNMPKIGARNYSKWKSSIGKLGTAIMHPEDQYSE